MRRRISGGVAVAMAALMTTSCAGWRSQIDPQALRYDQIAAARKPAATKKLLLTMTVIHPGADQKIQESRTTDLRESALEYLGNSGYFAEVGINLTDPDLELVLNINEEEHFSMGLTILAGLTLLAIPAHDRVETTTFGEIFSGSGEKLGEVRGEQSMSVLLGLLMFPAIPSLFIAKERSEDDIFKSILAQLLENESVWQ